jgi:hypothetical protein
MTAEIVNLNRVRKARARAERQRQAEENRSKFGQSKVDRQLNEVLTKRREQALDGAKRDPSDDEGNGSSTAS